MKPKMNLTVRISIESGGEQRYTADQITSEINNGNIQFGGESGTLLVRQTDGAVLGEVMTNETYPLNEMRTIVLNDGEEVDAYLRQSDFGEYFWVSKDGDRTIYFKGVSEIKES